MENEMIISLDSVLIEEAKLVLDQIGLEIQNVVKVLLKRIVREQSLAFLLASKTPIEIAQTKEISSEVGKNQKNIVQDVQYNTYKKDQEVKGDMTKNKAIQLFRNEGILFNKSITFASKNRGAYNYWANPSFEMLYNDWYIILNDWNKRELYLFIVPSYSIDASELTPRSDKNVIDLQIMYDDKTFSDNRSNYSFAKYLFKQISY